MSGSLNRATLIGNLGKDPEVRRSRDGKPIVNFSLATTESWRDKASGERKSQTEWHNVVIFNEGLAKVAESYLKKGSKVFIEGQIKSRKYQDKDGNDRYTTEIVLQAFNGTLTLLDGKDSDGGSRGGSGDRGGSSGGNSRGGGGGGGRSQQADSFPNDVDDDIPF